MSKPGYEVKTAETLNGQSYASGVALVGVGTGLSEGFAEDWAADRLKQEARIQALEEQVKELMEQRGYTKVGDTIRSANFVEGVSGWEMRDGKCYIHGDSGSGSITSTRPTTC